MNVVNLLLISFLEYLGVLVDVIMYLKGLIYDFVLKKYSDFAWSQICTIC